MFYKSQRLTHPIYHDDVIKWRYIPRYWPLCGDFTGPGEFPAQRPVTRSFNDFFDLRLNKRLSKQSWGWWFETPSRPLCRHRNVQAAYYTSTQGMTISYSTPTTGFSWGIGHNLSSIWSDTKEIKGLQMILAQSMPMYCWYGNVKRVSWWRHQMKTFSALLALCAGNSPVPGAFSAQRPVTRSFDVLFDMRLDKQLSKQSRGWWFEMISRPLWRHCNVKICIALYDLTSCHEAIIIQMFNIVI